MQIFEQYDEESFLSSVILNENLYGERQHRYQSMQRNHPVDDPVQMKRSVIEMGF